MNNEADEREHADTQPSEVKIWKGGGQLAAAYTSGHVEPLAGITLKIGSGSAYSAPTS